MTEVPETPTEGMASDFRPCLLCGMPDFDHGDGSPTDHPFDPDLEWVDPQELLEAEVHQSASPERFAVNGKDVYCDGQMFIESTEPEVAQGLVEILNEAIRIDRASRARVMSRVRKDRVARLQEVLLDPSKVAGPRYKTEQATHWAARAVMKEVDLWL